MTADDTPSASPTQTADADASHDHTHVSPQRVVAPADHSHAVAPAAPHLHPHEGHVRAAIAPERAQGAPPVVDFEGVCAGYFGRDVLEEVSFAVQRGDFVGIIGPNGSGKSTLLKAIAGLLRLKSGEMLLDGASIALLPARERARPGRAG